MKRATNRFETIARIYDPLAKLVFGRSIIDAQLCFLNRLPKNGTVLIIGGGTGWLLPVIFKHAPQLEVTYVEASATMLNKAKQQVTRDNKVIFILGTEYDIPQGVLYNVIITNFFLDLFKESHLKDVVRKLRSHLMGNGTWIVTEFTEGEKYWQKILLWLMYRFFRATCNIEADRLPLWQEELKREGLKEEEQKFFYHNFICTAFYSTQ